MDSVVQQDINEIINTKIEALGHLSDKTVLITGATGMIGRYLTCLLAENLTSGSGSLIVNVRNEDKARSVFDKYLGNKNFHLLVSDVNDLTSYEGGIDYIIHAASPTQPQDFLDRPVEIIRANVFATNNLLELAKEKSAHFCLLSTLEIYGKVEAPKYPVHVTERDFGALNSIDLRSAYPESKRLAENLCVAFRKQYNVPSTIVRLAPTISPVIEAGDKRVYAQFIHNAIKGDDITVFSDAATKERSYTYISDAVTGILTAITASSEENFVFNLANNKNTASIQNLAETIITNAASGSKLNIVERTGDTNTSNATGMVILDSQKLLNAGWVPRYSLEESVKRTISANKEN